MEFVVAQIINKPEPRKVEELTEEEKIERQVRDHLSASLLLVGCQEGHPVFKKIKKKSCSTNPKRFSFAGLGRPA